MSWEDDFKTQREQLKEIRKMYALHGLELRGDGCACPEQYDVFKDGKQVAYYRLRWGEFTVDYPDVNGEEIIYHRTNGDGMFDDDERIPYLESAMYALLEQLKKEQQ